MRNKSLVNITYEIFTIFVLCFGITSASFGQSGTCENSSATLHSSTFGTPCDLNMGSCWARKSDFGGNVITGLVDAGPYFNLSTGQGNVDWAAQCTAGDEQLQPVCIDGLDVYAGAFNTPCEAVSGVLYSCWKNTSQSVLGAVDASEYGATGWQVQCQIGTPQLGEPVEPPQPFEPPFSPSSEYTANLPNDNLARNLSWDETYSQSSLLMDFDRTRDPEYLREFIHRAIYVTTKRDDMLNPSGSANPVWTYTVPIEVKNQDSECADAGLDGMILTPLAEFLFMYSQKKYLFNTALSNELQLELVKTYFEQIIQSTSNYHEANSWNSQANTYKMNQSCDLLDSRSRVLKNYDRLPFNLIAAMGRVHFMLYKSNNDAVHLQKASDIANDLNNHFEFGANGEIFWPYWYVDPTTDQPEDMSHGMIVADFIKLLADHRVVFDEQTIRGLDKTIRYFTLSSAGTTTSPNVIYHYIGQRRDVYYSHSEANDPNHSGSSTGRALAGWLPFIPYRNWVELANQYIPTFSDDFDKLVASYKNSYTRLTTYGGACKTDGQCTTDICYAGLVCGNRLGTGSGCYRDKECDSGNCAPTSGGGKICQ